MSALHERIKQAREECGIGIGDMANRLSIHRNTYRAMEAGGDISVANLAAISEITRRPVSWFIYGTDGVEQMLHDHAKDIRRIYKLLSKLPVPIRALYFKQSIDVLTFLDSYMNGRKR